MRRIKEDRQRFCINVYIMNVKMHAYKIIITIHDTFFHNKLISSLLFNVKYINLSMRYAFLPPLPKVISHLLVNVVHT